jgi:hypothetical protein
MLCARTHSFQLSRIVLADFVQIVCFIVRIGIVITIPSSHLIVFKSLLASLVHFQSFIVNLRTRRLLAFKVLFGKGLLDLVELGIILFRGQNSTHAF